MMHNKIHEVIYAQAKQVELDCNVIELLSVRADFHRLSKMLATKSKSIRRSIGSKKPAED